MAVLIVESVRELGRVWQSALERLGADVELATSQSDAISKLMETEFDIIVMNVVLGEGGAFAVSDFVNCRWPGKPIFFVTSTSFFSDGSIFSLCSNACAYVQSDTAPDDLASMVQHYAM